MPSASSCSWRTRETRRPVVEDLESAGYRVITAERAWEAVRQVGQDPPGMVLLDMRTRGGTDRSFVRDVSLGHDIPVVLIAAGGSQDVALAFEAGGDDCITYPLEGEALARMGEALRRRANRGAGAGRGTIRLGRMTISHPERRVAISGRTVQLPMMGFNLLWELAANAGCVMTHEALIARLWGPGSGKRSTNLRTAIKNLRRRLGDAAASPSYIFTMPKAGYRMRRDGEDVEKSRKLAMKLRRRIGRREKGNRP